VIGQAECMNWLGDVARAEGDADRARERYEEALTLAPKIRDPFLTGLTYRNLARVAVDPAERARIESAVEEEIADAFAFAEASPFPAAEELMSDIFKEEGHAAITR